MAEPINYDELDPERAAETAVAEVNRFKLSGTKVAQSQSREFWEAIIENLKAQINALDD